jgi:glycosyltransferase involved in cell wall biosynthesis
MVSQISVIIPAYNRASLIGETLRSLLNQTMPAKEIIVVDDGSQDGTAEKTLEAFENWKLETGNWKNDDGEQVSANSTSSIQHPTLKILSQANAGPGAARNRGLAEATGEFIHFFDSDDIAAPNKHEVQLEALLRTGADIAYGPWVKGHFAPVEKLKDFLTTDDTDKHGYQKNQPGNAQGTCAGDAFSNPFTSELARDCENTSPTRSASRPAEALFADHGEIGGAAGEYSSFVPIRDIRGSNFSLPRNFVPEGPVLQARGLPEGDLIKALLTNWSIVPHACLFRRSILEKIGGFPEDIWIGEDQLLFLRCLLAGAKVVHTPETLVLYRLGEEGKLTESKDGHVRRVKHWARFLVKASQEVGSHAEARRRGDFVLTTEDTENTEVTAGQRLDKPSCAAFSNLSTSALARDSENTSPSRCASGPAEEALRVDYMGSGSAGGNQLADSKEFLKGQSQAGLQIDNQKDPTIRTANDPSASEEYSSSVLIRDIRGSNSATLDSSTPPAEWFGFRLRAYEAWRDLEKFFPDGEDELKNELQAIWKRNWFSGFRFQVSGFVLRKWGGLMNQIFGHRMKGCFRPGKFTSREATLFDNR